MLSPLYLEYLVFYFACVITIILRVSGVLLCLCYHHYIESIWCFTFRVLSPLYSEYLVFYFPCVITIILIESIWCFELKWIYSNWLFCSLRSRYQNGRITNPLTILNAPYYMSVTSQEGGFHQLFFNNIKSTILYVCHKPVGRFLSAFLTILNAPYYMSVTSQEVGFYQLF